MAGTELAKLYNTDLRPAEDGLLDLGSLSYQWKDLYLTGVAYIDSLSMEGNIGMNGNGITGLDYIYGTDATSGISFSTSGVCLLWGDTSVQIYNCPLDLDNNNIINVGTIDVNGLHLNTTTETSAYDITINDDIIFVDASGGSVTVTLPPASTCTGKIIIVKALDIISGGNVTIDGASSETIDGVGSKQITTDYDKLKFASDGTNWYVL